jgi:DNA-binding transcriptional ArsR family regulator
MDVESEDAGVSAIAGAIAEPARTRMLYCLMDGHARTSTELAVVAGVSPSTASVHLARLVEQGLVTVLAQGKHRYHSLQGPAVAAALEALSVLAGGPRARFVPNTPTRLRTARTCYDHMAGAVAVALHDRCHELGWLVASNAAGSATDGSYELSAAGGAALEALGIDVHGARKLRRRFACACVDWSERRPHLGGALGAALLSAALKRRWVVQDADSRALRVTPLGEREVRARFQLRDRLAA